jgi:hypothetical protein
MSTPREEYIKAIRNEDHDCDLIATNAGYSYWYAINIIKGRFPKGENTIPSRAYYSNLYANFINQDFIVKPNR